MAAAIYAMLDEPVRAAHHWPRPSPVMRWLVVGGLKARAVALRCLPRRRLPHLQTHVRHRTYRRGYRLEDLGAEAAHLPRPQAIEQARRGVEQVAAEGSPSTVHTT